MHEFLCENFLVPVDPNAAGYTQSKNFLRQWYIHGPVPMSDQTRKAAESGHWDRVIDTEALPDEANLKPNVQPVQASNCYGNAHTEIAVTGQDTLYCAYADDEYDIQGNRMPSKMRQMYGRHIRVERL